MTIWDFSGTGAGVAGAIASTNFGDQKQVARVLQQRFDLVNNGGTGFGDTFASGDTLKLFNVQPGWIILAAGFQVVTACNTSSTIALGDGDSTTTWTSAISAASTGFKTAGSTFKQYTSTETIIATVGGASITTGIVEFWAIVVDASYRIPAKVAVL